jgi:hypothetical protein
MITVMSAAQLSASGGLFIEVEQAAQPRVASDATRPVDARRSHDESIAKALVIPFEVVVGNIFMHGLPKVPLPAESAGRGILP